MAIADSIVNGALGLIGQGIQIDFEKQQAQQEREWNEAMMDKQNQWTLDMWNRTNEYNSPSAQRQRLEEAGLNPLYFGLDGSSAGQVESAQALGYQRASMAGMDNPVQAGLNAMLTRAEIEKTQAEAGKLGEETTTEVKRRQEMQAQIDKITQDIKASIAGVKLTEAQTESVNKSIAWLDALNEAQLHYQESMSAVNEETAKRIKELLPGEKLLQSKTIEQMSKNIEQMNAEIKKLAVDTGIAEQDLLWYTYNHLSNGLFGTGVSIQNIGRLFQELINRLTHQGAFNNEVPFESEIPNA